MNDLTEKLWKEASQKMEKALNALKIEFSNVRTGRANPNMLDQVKVDYYGTLTPVTQVGTVNVPEPQLITIVPWEKKILPEIVKAILKADLGMTPINDGNSIRLPIPPLNEERRKELVKKIKKIAEHFRTEIRNFRREANNKLKEMEKEKQLSEDEMKKKNDDIQKITDTHINEIDALTATKEKELLEV